MSKREHETENTDKEVIKRVKLVSKDKAETKIIQEIADKVEEILSKER